MNKIFGAALAAIIIFPLGLLSAPRHADGDYVIALNGNDSPTVVKRQHGVGRRAKDKEWVTALHGFSAHLTGAQSDRLENDTRVAFIEADIPVHSLASPITGWVNKLGGLSSDIGRALASDSAGNVYVAGSFMGTVDFGNGPLTSGGAFDIFLAKYSSSGACLYARQYGNLGTETPRALAVDGSGNVYLVGSVAGQYDLGGGFSTAAGVNDIFVAKYGPSGLFIWSKVIGGTLDDVAAAIALDSTGNVIVTGYFKGTVDFLGTTLISTFSGLDTFLMKLDPSTGAKVWVEKFTNDADDEGTGVACDNAGNIYLTGRNTGTINLGTTNMTVNGGGDFYLGKFNSAGVCQWAEQFGGINGDRSVAVACDNAGSVYLYAYFTTSINLGGGIINSTSGSDADIVLAKYSTSNGAYVWAQRFSGTGSETPTGMAIGGDGNIYLSGYFSFSITVGGNTFNAFTAGQDDGFVAAYSPAGASLWSAQLGGTGLDEALAISADGSGRAAVTGFFSGTAAFNGTSLTSAGGLDAFLGQFSLQAMQPAQVIPTGVRRIGTLSNAVAAINGTDTRVNVDVAIIDTGIDLTHPDLNVVQNVSFVTGAATGADDNGHGTHVAGTVGALDNSIGVVGVAPGVRLWAVKALDSTGSGNLSQIISGVDYVTQHADQISVANMSLGGQGTSDTLRLAIQGSVAKGVVYVVAAGNSNFDIYGGDKTFGTADDFFPASYPEVMTVSAMADTDGLYGGFGPGSDYGADDTMATFSAYSLAVVASNPVFSPGRAIDVCAPGVNILSTWLNHGYNTISGTSMASPHAAGAVALYIAANSRATTSNGVAAIRQAIINAATPPPWGNANWNPNPLFDFYPEPLINVAPNNPLNSTPVVTISAPANGSIKTNGTAITFTGTATDAEDGALSSTIVWDSNLIGTLGTGASLVTSLSPGNHTITDHVIDSGGKVGTASILLSVVSPATNTAPTVTITVPTNNSTFLAGATVSFAGTASDTEDGAGGQFLASTSAGSASFNDYGQAVSTDQLGNVYVGGVMNGQGYFAKFSPSLGLLWSHSWGGDGTSIRSIAIDASGNVLITGNFTGLVNFGSGVLTSAGGYDIFVAEFTSDGVNRWSKRFGSSDPDLLITETAYGAAFDSAGNIFLTGAFLGSMTFGGPTLTNAGGQDIFIAKLAPDGTHIWSKAFGTVADEWGTAIACDSSGNVFLTGRFAGTINFGGSPLTASGVSVFVVKYASNGSHVWSKGFGNGGTDIGNAIGVDSSGNVTLAGVFQTSINFGGSLLTNSAFKAMFVAQLSGANGVHQWSKAFGGDGVNSANGLAVALDDSVFVAGQYVGTSDFGGITLSSTGGGTDDFVAKYSKTGTLAYVRGAGSAVGDICNAVAVDSFGNGFITGAFINPVTFDGTTLTSKGSNDIFLSKFAQSFASLIKWWVGGSQFGSGPTASMTFSQGAYTVSAIATDSGFLSVTNTVSFTVGSRTPPTVTITTPASGAKFPAGTNITFTATATDTSDGNIASLVSWTSSRNGTLGTGASITRTNLAVGTNTVTASVTNTWGQLGSASITTIITNVPAAPSAPVLTITYPTNGATVAASTVLHFTATSVDGTDGDIHAGIQWWLTNVLLTTGSPVDVGFVQGFYTMTVVSTNTLALGTTNRVSFFADGGIINQPPTIAIVQPVDGLTFVQGYPVVFIAQVQDDLGIINNVNWTSSVDGPFQGYSDNQGTSVATNATLSVGHHIISAVVEDIGGGTDMPHLFGTNTIGLTIVSSNTVLPKLAITVTPDKTSYARKEKATMTAHVTSGGTNVPNAAVTMTMVSPPVNPTGTNPKTYYKTGLTDSAGNFVWVMTVGNITNLGTWSGQANTTKAGYAAGSGSWTFTTFR